MAKKISIARPTKMELIRLKRRIRLAKRIQKIVKDRLSILIMEFLQMVRRCVVVKERVNSEYAAAYAALSVAMGFHGSVTLKKEMAQSGPTVKIRGGTRNVAGVSIPFFEGEWEESTDRLYGDGADSSSYIDRTCELAKRCLEGVIELAELEKALELIGMEINRTKRINNALEYIIIPGLDETIKFLTMKFEERDREETSRLKFVKHLIEGRETYAF